MIPKHYELRPVDAIDDAGMIMTAAVMSCCLCCRVISGMGGPGTGVVCEPCADLLFDGTLKGVVTYEPGSN